MLLGIDLSLPTLSAILSFLSNRCQNKGYILSFTIWLPYLRHSAVPSSSLLRSPFFCLSLEHLPAYKVKKKQGFLPSHAVAASFLQNSSMTCDKISSFCSLKPFSSTSLRHGETHLLETKQREGKWTDGVSDVAH